MANRTLIQLIKDNAKVAIASLVIVLLGIIGRIVKEKIYFAWHAEHHFEMLFELERSKMDNRDGDKLYVIMENEVSGEVKYIVDILETSEGKEWVFIYDIWIMYPLRRDDHGRMYIQMEHEGNKYLFPK